jgi:hypothetical protein
MPVLPPDAHRIRIQVNIMRNFQTLEDSILDTDSGILTFTTRDHNPMSARLNLRREGENIAISAGYGPIEIAMRLRFSELARTISHLQPVDGLGASRQVGSGSVSIALGMQKDGTLVIRPMLITDSSGHITLNYELTPSSAAALRQWMGI